jgi:D-amino-acid dehydrogenase
MGTGDGLGSHVVVIGAGIVGAATAVELLRDGHRVTILEPGDPGGEQAASYGNGTLLVPSEVIPISTPGLWKKVPGYLLDPLGPLTIRWRYLPKLLPWLWRFLRAGSTEVKVAATARALRPLVANAPDLHRRLADEAGVGSLITRQGVLFVFPSRADFDADELSWRLRRENDTVWLELDADELRQRDPALDRRYTFGVLVETDGQCADPGAYVNALARHSIALGAKLCRECAVGFRLEGHKLRAVRTETGEIICDKAVICAGARSKSLAAAAGDRVSLETERGYHVVISNPGITPRHPVVASDSKSGCVMTPQGLRVAGQVELAGLKDAPNWRRAKVLLEFARRAYPGLPVTTRADQVKFWMGHRPSTPDGLPCIGPASGCRDVVHAYGHGHVGLTAGAATARLAADLVSGKLPQIDPAPYSPQRFS